MKKSHGLTSLAALASMALILSGCTNSDSEASGNTQRENAGFEFGAPQETVDVLIEDLPPVELTYQSGAGSQDTTTAAAGLAFKEAVEDRSNGKITIDITWGAAIAGYPELTDALNDGRVDIAYHTPVYFPDDFPTVDAYSKLTHYSEASPLVGEIINHAMMADYAWNSESLMSDYEEKGLVPLSPLVNSGDYWLVCNDTGSALEDWDGRQVRIAGTANVALAEAVGATPVSMEYGETFEALERGTVDCTFSTPQVSGSTGIMGTAPYLYHFAENHMTGSAAGAHVAGASFSELPLAYQQIIFDAEVDFFHGNLLGTMDAGSNAVREAKEAGGDIQPIGPDAESEMSEAQEAMVDELIANEQVPANVREEMDELEEKWREITEELGYTDEGDLSDLDEWLSEKDYDFRPIAQRLIEESALSHRPS